MICILQNRGWPSGRSWYHSGTDRLKVVGVGVILGQEGSVRKVSSELGIGEGTY
jgi:hypothetical protein